MVEIIISCLIRKGQTVIPKEIRLDSRLQSADASNFVAFGNGEAIIRPATQDIRRLKDLLHGQGRLPVSSAKINQAIPIGDRHSQSP